MEEKGNIQRGKRKADMSKAELARIYGFGKNKFQWNPGELQETGVQKAKMRRFSDIIQKSGSEEKIKKRKFRIAKADDEKHQAFGWANVSIRADGELIEDWQGDIVEPEELEQAAYKFVELYREGGEMHERGGTAVLIESVVFTEEKMKAIGIEPGTIPVGWWIGFKVLDDDVWEKVKDGTYSMFSIEGEAQRIEVDENGNEVQESIEES